MLYEARGVSECHGYPGDETRGWIQQGRVVYPELSGPVASACSPLWPPILALADPSESLRDKHPPKMSHATEQGPSILRWRCLTRTESAPVARRRDGVGPGSLSLPVVVGAPCR